MIPIPHREEMEIRCIQDKVEAIVRESKEDRIYITINGKRYYIDKKEWVQNYGK